MAPASVGMCIVGIQFNRPAQVLNGSVRTRPGSRLHTSQNVCTRIIGVLLDQMIEVPQTSTTFVKLLIGEAAEKVRPIKFGFEHKYVSKSAIARS